MTYHIFVEKFHFSTKYNTYVAETLYFKLSPILFEKIPRNSPIQQQNSFFAIPHQIDSLCISDNPSYKKQNCPRTLYYFE